MRRLILAATAFLAGVASGCFLKPAPAPGFRYSCESNADCQARDCSGSLIPMAAADGLIEDCNTDEVKADPSLGVGFRQSCVAGLCEFTCNIFTFVDDCPPSSGYTFCFNGICANSCGTDDPTKYGFEVNDDFCTPPQHCVPIEEGQLEPMLFESQGANFLKNLREGSGFCGTRCDAPGAPECPPGEYCTGAMCMPGCDNPDASPCADDTICFADFGFAACLTPCDESAELPCPDNQICVPKFDVCQPSCITTDEVEGVECERGFECSLDLGICVPEEFGSSASETGSSGSEESSG